MGYPAARFFIFSFFFWGGEGGALGPQLIGGPQGPESEKKIRAEARIFFFREKINIGAPGAPQLIWGPRGDPQRIWGPRGPPTDIMASIFKRF